MTTLTLDSRLPRRALDDVRALDETAGFPATQAREPIASGSMVEPAEVERLRTQLNNAIERMNDPRLSAEGCRRYMQELRRLRTELDWIEALNEPQRESA